MKLEKILDNLNSFEKNSFLKILDNLYSEKPKKIKEIDEILSDSKDLKNTDHSNIVKVFNLLEKEFFTYLKAEFLNTASQLDILIDIISKDGNSVIKSEWFSRLYDKELQMFGKKLKEFDDKMNSEKMDISYQRKRDYKVYHACLKVAYHNDENNNQDKKITIDEQSIINTLSSKLGLSQEEIKLINYSIIPVKRHDIEVIINELKSIGVVFFSKKNNTIYAADEIVRILRKIRGKEVSDKYFRRVLRLLREPQINLICRKNSINWKLSIDEKIKLIIKEGVSFSSVLIDDIYKEGTKLSDKKTFINQLCDKYLQIVPDIKGVLLEDKVENLIKYFDEVEKDEKVGISIDGYDKLLLELGQTLSKTNKCLKEEFELQDEVVLNSGYLLDRNIKPRDVLEVLSAIDLLEFCKKREIKTRGDLIINILEAYKDSENLYLENYVNIGYRNLLELKENNITIKESELGNKFEELTKNIFRNLGFQVDEQIRKSLNTTKDKTDIILNMGDNNIILVECKTRKESGYNKFSSVSRQLKSYSKCAENQNFQVIKSLLVAPEFSDDFIKDCGLEYELNLSLITANSLIKIMEGFKKSKLKLFPHNLLMRDVVVQEERVLKAICK